MANLPNLDELAALAKSDVGRGVLIGVGVAAVLPFVVPALLHAGKPAARAALKSAILLSEKTREAMAEAGETLEDIFAEVRAELAEHHHDVMEEPLDVAVSAAAASDGEA